MSNYGSIPIFDPPILSDFPATNVVYVGQFSGGDKPRPYLSGETSFVVAGFIPACKEQAAGELSQNITMPACLILRLRRIRIRTEKARINSGLQNAFQVGR
jgi:hypothetical protein